MSSVVFKRLFEVQFVHDYFLTAPDGTSFFERNQEDKRDTLVKKLTQGIYNVQDMVTIEPTDNTKLRMRESKLILGKTALGFIVGTEVTVEEDAGEIKYRPRFNLHPKLSLEFAIRLKAVFMNSITNVSLKLPMPSIHYFTNKDKEAFDEITVPTYKSLPLARKAQNHQSGTTHEMGALVDFGGTVREALRFTDGSDPTHWEDTVDRRFVTNADRILLPNDFVYSLKREDAITEVTFVLEDGGGTAIKTKNITGAGILERVHLNFSRVDETDENSASIPSGFYTLKVTANANPEIAYPIYLNDKIYAGNLLGIVDIRLDEIDSPFSILDAQGFLKTKIDASNVKVPHPVFEIRFKNRRTYWRYNRDVPFQAGDTNAHLNLEAPRLVSKKPKALTEALVPFINGTSLLLPHPYPSIKVEGDRIFSEVFINPSNRLLN